MVNRLIASENMAKSIVVMKPGMFSLKRFDLAIIPEHDNAPKLKNVISVKGALSRHIDKDDERIKSIISDYSLDNPPLSHPAIGVLLGGESKHLYLDVNAVEKLADSLDEVVEKLKGSILISTSRRTAENVEGILKTRLSGKQGCRMLVIANETNPPGAFETILHLSDILVVSGDSISMVSEAINSQKYTIIIKLRRKDPNFVSKHEKFVEKLSKDGFIYLCEDNLTDMIKEIWSRKPPRKVTDDSELIIKKLEQIL
jgi:mitochondrial fission protein ELM1